MRDRIPLQCPGCDDGFFYAEVTPPTPPPMSWDHDSPNFSDPGDPGGFDCIVDPHCGKCGYVMSDDEAKTILRTMGELR